MGMTFARDSRYDALSMALHWLSAALVLIALALIEMKGAFGKGGGRDLVKLLHYQAGALVVMVTVFRLGWCTVRRAPKASVAPGGVEEYVGRMVHWGLYAALLAVPVAGVVALLAAGKPTVLLGIDLPVWIDGGKAVAKRYKHYHESVANGMIALLVLHVGAALWHRYVRRDAVMQRMLPGG
ncbi:MAG: cytochrome b [Rhodocyclaceae bacterium]|nr:MAG: cytochrome b [Rhodocyclaceae bacterium]